MRSADDRRRTTAARRPTAVGGSRLLDGSGRARRRPARRWSRGRHQRRCRAGGRCPPAPRGARAPVDLAASRHHDPVVEPTPRRRPTSERPGAPPLARAAPTSHRVALRAAAVDRARPRCSRSASVMVPPTSGERCRRPLGLTAPRVLASAPRLADRRRQLAATARAAHRRGRVLDACRRPPTVGGGLRRRGRRARCGP